MDRPVCIVKPMANPKIEGSARERLLAAANELFYAEGVHTVGIDRVIERAGVAKASLYSSFGSKDELVRAYLLARHEARQRRIVERIAQSDAPRERILAIFDLMGEMSAEPTYRGCAFVNASAEGGPNQDVRRVCDTTRAWIRGLFTRLAADLGAADPALLGNQLMLLYDGASTGASMDRDVARAGLARQLAEILIDSQPTAAKKSARSAPKRTRPTAKTAPR
jgi:AcrR family transcriptional regulator